MVRTRRRRPGSTRPTSARDAASGSAGPRAVTRRPWVSALATTAVLLALAIPALSLDFGNGALRQFPEGNETRVGAELAAQTAGPGAAGPAQVVAELRSGRASDPRQPRGAQLVRVGAAARSRGRSGERGRSRRATAARR